MKLEQSYNMQFSVGKDAEAIAEVLEQWQTDNKVKRLWAGDATLWTNTDESKWTGWLQVATQELNEVTRIMDLAHAIKTEGITDLVVLGMGGSSLCPAMMAGTFGKIDHHPQLHVLDSTDPQQIQHLQDKIDISKTYFIVSSKSGSTLEPNIFTDYFYAQVQQGSRFIAITDPGTALETLAKKEQFKAIFYGVPSIGGRYSALSNFGMVPAGLMGINIKLFLQHAEKMQAACRESVAEKNPGVMLGAILGVCGKNGKDKITLIVSPGIHDLGAWLEQLLAESTGKDDKGLIPVDQEPLNEDTSVYGDDRLFVYIRLDAKPDENQDQAVRLLEQSGFSVVRLSVKDKMHLGAELFRWEIATAVCGSILGINPFNQPNVEESKVLTLQLADEFEKTGTVTTSEPFFTGEGLSLFTDAKNAEVLKTVTGTPSITAYLRTYFTQIEKNDYVDLAAFIEMSDEHVALLQDSRFIIRNHKKVATCLGFGPRFLHSTGQAYKGGPNTGVFLQITADHEVDLQVPDHRYTFGFVIATQAQADLTVLSNRGRRILRIHLGKDVVRGLEQLRECMQQACSE